jgi:hypothetical protein
MISKETCALAMIRWHWGFHSGGGGFTGILIGVAAVCLLVWGLARTGRSA